MYTEEQVQVIADLGQRLRTARIARNDTQKEFAGRLFVSVPTLQKMEKGSPNVALGTWVKAMDILNKLEDLNTVLAPPKSLAERYEISRESNKRQRVRKPIKKKTAENA